MKSGGTAIADTGAPYSTVSSQLFAGEVLPHEQVVSVDIGLGPITVEQVKCVQVAFDTSQLLIGGLLGGDVMRQFSTQFDYRDQVLRLGAGPGADDVEVPGTTFGFHLEGGGPLTTVKPTLDVPSTRIAVEVELEGAKHLFLLDTGSYEVLVRTSLFSQLTADGRPTIEDDSATDANGTIAAHISRARTITVAGESVSNVPFVAVTAVDDLIDGISKELGRTFDGTLGGDFLREFLVTVDYPHQRVTLQRYSTRAHIVDEFQRVGIKLRPSTGMHRFAIATVFANTDAAAQHLVVGDEVLAIDANALDSLDAISADLLLDGAVGTSRTLTILPAGSQSETTVGVRVDDLIPVR